MGRNTENLTKYLETDFLTKYEGSTKEVDLEARLETVQRKQKELLDRQEEAEKTIQQFPYYITCAPAAFVAITTGMMKCAETAYNLLNGRDTTLTIESYETTLGLIAGALYAGLLCFNRLHAKIQIKNSYESMNAYKKEEKQINKELREFR